MNKKYFILLIICTIFVIEFTSADIISECRTISSSGYYELNQSITGTGTCMTIANSDVDFNCNGSTIYYNTAGGATTYGINVIYLLVPLDNITIRNCVIKDINESGTPSGGIQFTRVTDSYIFNNTIQTNGTTLNHGVTLTTGCKRNRIENNTINTWGSGITNVGIYLTTEASNNNITGNNVVGIGTLTSYAVYLAVDANDNLVNNNNLSTVSTVAAANADPHVVVITSSKRNDIFNNNIYGQGDRRGYAVYVTTNAESTNIENNSILMNLTPTGSTGYGIYLLRTSITKIRNNNISMLGTGTLHGVYMTNAPYTNASKNVININIPAGSTFSGFTSSANSPYSELKENNITINGVGTFNGISITSSGSSVIENNILSLNGSATTINGIISTDSPVSSIQNNNISIGGTTTLNGISATTSYTSTIQNNNISISGTTTLNGILATSSRFALLQNNSINVTGSASTTTAPATGIYFSSSSVGTVKNNSIYLSGAAGVQGVYLYYNSLENLVEENVISTYGTGNTNPGVYLTTGSNDNTIQKNIITTNGLGTTNYGVYILTSSNNVVYLNNISTSGTTTNYGVYLLTQAGNNTIKNNIISTYGTTTNYGIYINSANYNRLIGNNITANGSTRVAGTTTNNHGIAIGASSYFSEVYNNTAYTDGGRYNYGIYLLTNSRWGIFTGNKIYTGGTGALNVGAYISESHYNIFENNVVSTSGSATNHAIYLHSSSMGNTIENNNISTSGGTDSHAFGFLYVAAGGYPVDNILKNNRLISISGRDLNFETASTNGTVLIDQTIGNYSFTGTAGTLIIRNESVGQIEFGSVLSGNGIEFSNHISLGDNLAKINESVSALNKSATITFYNVSNTSTELQIYRNGVVCPETICTNLTGMNTGNVTFNVTYGGNYSINPNSSLPNIALNYPEPSFNSSSQNMTFNFTAIDDSLGNLSCSIYLDNLLNQTNSTLSNNTQTSFIIRDLQEGNHNWSIECYDSAGNKNMSELRNFSVIISQPSYSFNYPGNNSYINNVSSILLNYTVFDSDLRNMTVYLYGNDLSLNTSVNIENGTELIYNWTGLSLGYYNWSIETSNGIKNSTKNNNYFNLINLTLNCEAGGPYLSEGLVLVQGNISNGTSELGLQSLNVSVYRDNSLIDSEEINSSSQGNFQTSFSNLSDANYLLNVSSIYQAVSVSCLDNFSVGGSVLTPASFVLDKVASLYDLNNETFSYNITLRLTNKGGSNATSVNITDTDYTENLYNNQTLVAGESIIRSYIINFTRNSTVYFNQTSLAQVSGIDSSSNNLISANSSLVNLTIPSTESEQQLTVIKNVFYNNQSSTSVNYNLTVQIVNSGGIDLTGIDVLDLTDLGLGVTIDLNRTQSYTHSGQITIQKAQSNTEKSFSIASATVNSTIYNSTQISVLIPGYGGGPNDVKVYPPSSVSASTSFDAIINITNQNPDIGQDFTITYWITNDDETVNYSSSGQQTIYILALATNSTTVTLTSPSSTGTYRLKTSVSGAGITTPASGYGTFDVTATNSETPASGTSGSSGRTITSSAISNVSENETQTELPEEVICGSPYIRYERGCCLDKDNNSICDYDEKPIEKKEEKIVQNINFVKYWWLLFTILFFIITYKAIKNKWFSKHERGLLITLNLLFTSGLVYLLITRFEMVLEFIKNNLITLSIIFGVILLVFIFVGLIILIRKVSNLKENQNKKIKISKSKNKHSKNSVLGLINREVYTDSGYYIGKIEEVIIEKGKIKNLIIKVKNHRKYKAKGIVMEYSDIKNVGEVIIISRNVLEKLNVVIGGKTANK